MKYKLLGVAYLLRKYESGATIDIVCELLGIVNYLKPAKTHTHMFANFQQEIFINK
jgi:hypothetical protein